MMLLSLVLSAVLSCAPISTEQFVAVHDSATMMKHAVKFIESYVSVPSESVVMKYVSTQSPDGSWPDLDYKSKLRSSWPPGTHCSRVLAMARYYHKTGDPDIRDAVLKGMDWWGDNRPICTNWWSNVIGCPKTLGPAYILMKGEMNGKQLADASWVLAQSPFGRTGQNKVWQAGNVLIKAVLENDPVMLKAARDTIASEIRITTEEGIQPDMSFHQHGPQIQMGNYGLSYASTMAWWAKAFNGTPLEFDGQQMDILKRYVADGVWWFNWNGYFDFSACGRQVFKDTQRSKANGARRAMQLLGLNTKAPLTGAKYFPYSDVGVYRTADWYASVRMHSSRTLGYEQTNRENMKSFFTADGALMVRRAGDEYENIMPGMDWRHIPGVTSWDDGSDLWGGDCKQHRNNTELVFGEVSGDMMAAAMEIDRAGLHARKAWFFCPDGIVCLGSGITMDAEGVSVTTAVNQCSLRGPVSQKAGKWVNHDGISYVILDGNKYEVYEGVRAGCWNVVYPSYSKKDIAKVPLFDMYTVHGEKPQGATYAYMVLPGGMDGKQAFKLARKKVKILSNTPELQKVSIGGSTVTVDWTGGKVVWE